MDRKTRSNRTFSSWACISVPNPNFDLAAGLCALLKPDAIDAASISEHELEPSEPELADQPCLASPPLSSLPTTPGPSSSAPSFQQPGPSSPITRKQKLKAAGKARAKKKKQNPVLGGPRISKAICERHPEDASAVRLGDMAMQDSPVTSTGFVALNDVERSDKVYTLAQATGEGSELGFTLQPWNGRDPTVIVDKNMVVCVILAGQPNAPNWKDLREEAATALEDCRQACSMPYERLNHRRGAFAALLSGISHGGGQRHPMNLKNQSKNKELLDKLNKMECFTRVANFASAVMKRHAPDLYAYYAQTLDDLCLRDCRLKRPFQSSVFGCVSYNLGPRTVCYPHKDNGNISFGWCPVTPYGAFDSKKGGHLILWECHLVIEFPPGSTILLPSAVITHSNCDIGPNETRYSFTQFTAGALFRWRHNNHQRAVDFQNSLSVEEVELDKKMNERRWEDGLALLPTFVAHSEPEIPHT